MTSVRIKLWWVKSNFDYAYFIKRYLLPKSEERNILTVISSPSKQSISIFYSFTENKKLSLGNACKKDNNIGSENIGRYNVNVEIIYPTGFSPNEVPNQLKITQLPNLKHIMGSVMVFSMCYWFPHTYKTPTTWNCDLNETERENYQIMWKFSTQREKNGF